MLIRKNFILIFHIKRVCPGIFCAKLLSIPYQKVFIGLTKQVTERSASQEHQLINKKKSFRSP